MMGDIRTLDELIHALEAYRTQFGGNCRVMAAYPHPRGLVYPLRASVVRVGKGSENMIVSRGGIPCIAVGEKRYE
jgi:hypothetical protein